MVSYRIIYDIIASFLFPLFFLLQVLLASRFLHAKEEMERLLFLLGFRLIRSRRLLPLQPTRPRTQFCITPTPKASFRQQRDGHVVKLFERPAVDAMCPWRPRCPSLRRANRPRRGQRRWFAEEGRGVPERIEVSPRPAFVFTCCLSRCCNSSLACVHRAAGPHPVWYVPLSLAPPIGSTVSMGPSSNPAHSSICVHLLYLGPFVPSFLRQTAEVPLTDALDIRRAGTGRRTARRRRFEGQPRAQHQVVCHGGSRAGERGDIAS